MPAKASRTPLYEYAESPSSLASQSILIGPCWTSCYKNNPFFIISIAFCPKVRLPAAISALCTPLGALPFLSFLLPLYPLHPPPSPLGVLQTQRLAGRAGYGGLKCIPCKFFLLRSVIGRENRRMTALSDSLKRFRQETNRTKGKRKTEIKTQRHGENQTGRLQRVRIRVYHARTPRHILHLKG